jgi:putative ABC transport system substrate-binding protein
LSESGQSGEFCGQNLEGAKPPESSFRQNCKVVINLTVAKALGLTVPPTLLARAD